MSQDRWQDSRHRHHNDKGSDTHHHKSGKKEGADGSDHHHHHHHHSNGPDSHHHKNGGNGGDKDGGKAKDSQHHDGNGEGKGKGKDRNDPHRDPHRDPHHHDDHGHHHHDGEGGEKKGRKKGDKKGPGKNESKKGSRKGDKRGDSRHYTNGGKNEQHKKCNGKTCTHVGLKERVRYGTIDPADLFKRLHTACDKDRGCDNAAPGLTNITRIYQDSDTDPLDASLSISVLGSFNPGEGKHFVDAVIAAAEKGKNCKKERWFVSHDINWDVRWDTATFCEMANWISISRDPANKATGFLQVTVTVEEQVFPFDWCNGVGLAAAIAAPWIRLRVYSLVR